MRSPFDMTRMTTVEIGEAIKNGTTTAIIVLGAQEQHGAHLPMATDSIWGEHVADLVARKIGGALIAPIFSVGFSPEHMHFSGSITLKTETWGAVVEDYISSLEHHGFTRIVLVVSHGGNFFPLIDLLPNLQAAHPKIAIVAYTDLLGEVAVAAQLAISLGVTPEEAGAHGGEWETSMMLAVEPESVHRDREEPGYLGDLGPVLDQINAEGMEVITPNGILGDPAKASAENGHAYLECVADLLANYINQEADSESRLGSRA